VDDVESGGIRNEEFEVEGRGAEEGCERIRKESPDQMEHKGTFVNPGMELTNTKRATNRVCQRGTIQFIFKRGN